MATLKAMFKLFDGYSATIDKIDKKTSATTDKILKASGATDKLNTKLQSTGASAGNASSGLGKLITVVASYATAIKGMSIADEYTNTNARLGLITDSQKEQLDLQNKIFASADRSKGSYSAMAAAVSKIGITASEAFSSNGILNTDELVAFTELIQKGFKVGGASTTEQSSGMLQLTQAMGAGKLQGDEFRSIMENAPMVADAIAKYMGKSKGELKQMSSDGVITADIIKNAMFAASDDINDKFAEMPYTFADIWNKIKNGATKAFGPLIKRVNKIINSEKFQGFTDGVISGFYMIANVADKVLNGLGGVYDYISTNWPKLVPIIMAAVAAWGAYKLALLAVQAAQWAMNIASMINPIGLVIILVVALAAAFVLLWEKCDWFRELYVNMWKTNMKIGIKAYNLFAKIGNFMRDVWNSLIDAQINFSEATRNGMSAFVDIIAESIKGAINNFSNFINVIGLAVDAYNSMAKAAGLDTIEFDVSAKGLSDMVDSAASLAKDGINGAFDKANKLNTGLKFDKKMKTINEKKALALVDTAGDLIKNFSVTGWLGDTFEDALKAFDKLKDDDTVVPVKGTGTDGKVDVNMSDEDIQYLRDIAERDYINKFSTATLAPNISIKFGNVTKEADANKVAGRIKKILQEEIAISANG